MNLRGLGGPRRRPWGGLGLSLDGFWNQLSQRLGAHFLPLIEDGQQLRTLVGKVFHQETDSDWLALIDTQDWIRLFSLISESHSNSKEKLYSNQKRLFVLYLIFKLNRYLAFGVIYDSARY